MESFLCKYSDPTSKHAIGWGGHVFALGAYIEKEIRAKGSCIHTYIMIMLEMRTLILFLHAFLCLFYFA